MAMKKKSPDKDIQVAQNILVGTFRTENAECSKEPMAVSPNATDDFIKSRIFNIRGVQVMFDCDLASFYGVPTKRLNEQVKHCYPIERTATFLLCFE